MSITKVVVKGDQRGRRPARLLCFWQLLAEAPRFLAFARESVASAPPGDPVTALKHLR